MINIIIGFCFAVCLYGVANYVKNAIRRDTSKVMSNILEEIKKREGISYTYTPPPRYTTTTFMNIPKMEVLSKDELYETALGEFESCKITSDEFREICKMLDQGKLMDAQNKIFKL
ncbi:MAG: hypothetical protein EBR82_61205 [Caulobacteraceae bacterium]|jgi:hypothetical protein|nr:hypothetical protein [Caulobacteraceae bacterium]